MRHGILRFADSVGQDLDLGALSIVMSWILNRKTMHFGNKLSLTHGGEPRHDFSGLVSRPTSVCFADSRGGRMAAHGCPRLSTTALLLLAVQAPLVCALKIRA